MALFRRILAAIDFSPASERALEHAADLAAALALPLLVAHVYTPTVVFGDDGPWLHVAADAAEPKARAEELLGRAREQARARHAPIVDVALVQGEPVHEILRLAVDRDCDLIVVGPRCSLGPRDARGAVAERLVRAAPCAILAVGPQP